MSYLVLDGIKKDYSDFSINIDFSIDRGEFFTLLGPSGCGKTTLLRLIAGFIRPDKGNILLSGKNITGYTPRERNFSIVFQNYALFPNRNVYRNVSYGPESKRWERKRIKEKVTSLLAVTELEKHKTRKPDTLSGGEKQRVALARAVAAEPEILLLDEPLSALDVSLRNLLRDQIREIHDRTGITTIYVTHDQEEALYLSDRICIINNGSVEQIDTPENLYNNPRTFFTAGFIGESNIIPADSITEDSVISGSGVFSLPEKIADSGSSQQFLFFRPEACSIFEDTGLKEKNAITISVSKRVFLGSYYRIEGLTETGNRIAVNDYYPYSSRGKEIIRIKIDPKGVILFKR